MPRLSPVLFLILLSFSPVWADEKPRPVVRCLAFSPDGKTLLAGLSAEKTGELRLRETAKSVERWRVPYPAPVRAVCFLDSKTLIAAVGQSLLLIDAASGQMSKTLGKHDMPILALALSSDGKTLASGGEDRKIKLWDVAKGEEVKSIRQGATISTLAFSPNGKHLLCAAGREAATWDVNSGKKLVTFAHDGLHVSCAIFMPDGKEVLIGGNDGTTRVCDAENASQKMILQGLGGVSGLCYEPVTKTLAISGYRSVGLIDFDRRPDAATTKRIATLLEQLDEDDFDKRESAESALIKFGMLAEAALRNATSSKSAEVRIRARRALQTVLSKPRVKIEVARATVFSAGGKLLAVVGGDGGIELVDPTTGKAISETKK